jgi:aspartyl-tRNA(Asn)/glutamyl-tRNA(Gln) amidotransferase subunit A
MPALTRRAFVASGAAAAIARGQGDDLAFLSLAEASRRVRAKSVTAAQLVEACLTRIDTYNPKLNAFITVMKESARKQAATLDAEARAGKFRGPLHGIPIALKDNIDTAGTRTTAASAVFDTRIPDEDAEVTKRLLAAGAIVVGKTNLHEFAAGGTSVISYFGPVRNPWALDRHAGGSSGGSGAAVSAGMAYGALGTDTGGSIRTPASLCGIVGLKPTHGLVSIRGIVPLVWTLDHCGPMTRTVEDSAMMLQVLAGYDPGDLHSIERPIPDYAAEMRKPVKGLRLGVLRVPFFDHVEPDVRTSVETAIAEVMKMTAGSKDVILPDLRGSGLGGEMYAYHDEIYRTSQGRYQIPLRRSLKSGSEAKAFEYVKGWRKLMTLRREIHAWFEKNEVDLLVLPTRRRMPRTIDDSIKRAESEKPMNPELENTSEFNVLGIPAITAPCGFTSAKLPVGLMIAGRPWAEGQVLALAHAYEQAASWRDRRPPLTPDMPVPKLASTDSSDD